MDKIYTIGFTQKTAEYFFTLIKKNEITELIDIRLNHTSQLASFTKYPDIAYFLKQLCNIAYRYDPAFAPEESTLKRYKKKEITWDGYVLEFEQAMQKRKISEYIMKNYKNTGNICLLCSEPTPEHCHRSLVAEHFHEVFANTGIIHLL